MQDQRPNRQIPLGLIAGLSVLVLSTGSAVAWWTVAHHSQSTAPDSIQKSQPSEPEREKPIAPNPNASANSQPPRSQSPAASEQKKPEVYWLKPTANSVRLTPTPVKSPIAVAASDPALALESALTQLLAGPNKPADASTTIPKGTTLRSVAIQKDGIHVDLSKEFTTGGGAASMTGRVGQVLYTATSVQVDQPVWLSVEGKPLETLGGEGLVLEQPLTRDRFKQDFPQQ